MDGSSTDKMSFDYPIDHRRRRDNGIPELEKKFACNLERKIAPRNTAGIPEIVAAPDFVDRFVV